MGRLFRAISLAVVHGMPAGIGLVMIAGQLYALADSKAPDTTKFGPVDPSIFVADEDEEGAE